MYRYTVSYKVGTNPNMQHTEIYADSEHHVKLKLVVMHRFAEVEIIQITAHSN